MIAALHALAQHVKQGRSHLREQPCRGDDVDTLSKTPDAALLFE